jgi:hypothetical protein
MSVNTIKAYELYPYHGSFSVKTIDYHGTKITVAHQDTWINPVDHRPVGIVSIYRRNTGTTLWCDCSGHKFTGGYVHHGADITALRKAIEAHHCPRQECTLGHRLQAAATAEQQA